MGRNFGEGRRQRVGGTILWCTHHEIVVGMTEKRVQSVRTT